MENILTGKAWKLGDEISTDHIAPGRYFHLRSNLPELAKHLLEDADERIAGELKPGDFIVGGRNFGLGSSREHAPAIMKVAGVGAVLAESFARIFFRNAINVGLPAMTCDTSRVETGDVLEVRLAEGVVKNVTKDMTMDFPPLPPVMMAILSDGGLVPHVEKHGKIAV